MNKLAPIFLFTYLRLDTLKKCIASLKRNELSKFYKIYIFSDGPKNSKEINKIKLVRKYLKKIKGLKKEIFYRRKNYGLANNIIMGVTQIFKKEKINCTRR